MLVHSSPACPPCAQFHNEILPLIKAKFVDTGQLRVIIRPLARAGYGPDLYAARMLACAQLKDRQGTLEKLFAAQGEWAPNGHNPASTAADDELAASKLGAMFGTRAFEKCQADKSIDARLEVIRQEAFATLGLTKTPDFIIGGERFSGRMTAERLTAFVEQKVTWAIEWTSGPRADLFTAGSPTAPATMIEYCSLSKTDCGAFHGEVLPQLKKDYIDTGRLRYVFRPVLNLFPDDFAGYLLINCLPAEQRMAMVGRLIASRFEWAPVGGGPMSVEEAHAYRDKVRENLEAIFKSTGASQCSYDISAAAGAKSYQWLKTLLSDGAGALPRVVINGATQRDLSLVAVRARLDGLTGTTHH